MMILIYILILIMLISFILLNLNFLISKKTYISREKISPFECGFDPLNSSRLPFSINFFMIAILFLIFDVEIVFLLPLVNYLMFLNLNEWLYSSLLILMILFWGLEYEKFEGSLKWIF